MITIAPRTSRYCTFIGKLDHMTASVKYEHYETDEIIIKKQKRSLPSPVKTDSTVVDAGPFLKHFNKILK